MSPQTQPQNEHEEPTGQPSAKEKYETPEILKSEGLIDITSETTSITPKPNPKDR